MFGIILKTTIFRIALYMTRAFQDLGVLFARGAQIQNHKNYGNNDTHNILGCLKKNATNGGNESDSTVRA